MIKRLKENNINTLGDLAESSYDTNPSYVGCGANNLRALVNALRNKFHS